MKRHFWVVWVLIALLAAALACSSGGGGGDDDSSGTVSGDKSTATPKGPKQLFSDDFSDEDSGWRTGKGDEGEISYDDGEYVISFNTPSYLLWGYPDEEFSNVHLEAKVDATQAGDAAFGFICNYENENNFYYLAFGRDGYYAIAKYVDDELTIMTDPDSKWIKSSKIKESDSYTMGADCAADGTLTLYVNEKKIDSVKDDTFSSGYVGFLAHTFEDAEVEVRFDDFKVTELK